MKGILELDESGSEASHIPPYGTMPEQLALHRIEPDMVGNDCRNTLTPQRQMRGMTQVSVGNRRLSSLPLPTTIHQSPSRGDCD